MSFNEKLKKLEATLAPHPPRSFVFLLHPKGTHEDEMAKSRAPHSEGSGRLLLIEFALGDA